MFKRGDIWWTWVSDVSGRRERVSMATTLKGTAEAMERWHKDVKRKHDPTGLLTAVLDNTLSLGRAYQLGETGWVKRQEEIAADAADIDLRPAFEEWKWWLETQRVSKHTVEKYPKQVEAVLGTGPWKRSGFAVTPLWAKIDSLRVSEVTKGRYRAAVSRFCGFLVRKGLLDRNPCRDITGYPQSKARMAHYSPKDAMRLLEALPMPHRAVEALMYACGWERSAIANARVGDIDTDKLTAFARGTKNVNRTRLTIITEPAVISWIKEQMRGKLPNALLFDGLDLNATLRLHKSTVKALGLEETTLHDWRHTYAIKELKRGALPQHVAQMLGHGNANMVITRYGRWIATPDELMQAAQQRRMAEA